MVIVAFMQIEIDTYNSIPGDYWPGAENLKQVGVMRLFGLTEVAAIFTS